MRSSRNSFFTSANSKTKQNSYLERRVRSNLTYAFADDPNEEDINRCRVAMIRKQLDIYDKQKIHWSTWAYKDIGLMGMVSTRGDSPWNRLIWPHVEKKQRLYVDSCAIKRSPEVEELLEP